MNLQIRDLKEKAGKDEEAKYQFVLTQLESEKSALESTKSELSAAVLLSESLLLEKEKLNLICKENETEIVSLQVAVCIDFFVFK